MYFYLDEFYSNKNVSGIVYKYTFPVSFVPCKTVFHRELGEVAMASKISCLLLLFVAASCVYQSSALHAAKNQTAWLTVDASEGSGRLIPETLFGIFFEVYFNCQLKNFFQFLVALFSIYYQQRRRIKFSFLDVCSYFSSFCLVNAGDQSCGSWWAMGRTC